MQEGIILKGIAGFYYVKLPDAKVIECKARGRFRKEKLSPVVGDRVNVELIDEEHGVIQDIMERKNQMIRPPVANVDQAVVVFASKRPEIVFTLLDKLLILTEHNNLDAVICINKCDLDDDHIIEKVKGIYEKIGYRVLKTNGLTGDGMEELNKTLKGKISVFAGPSGVGKSTLFNRLQNRVTMETQDVSSKIDRGRHTTRHAELIDIDNDSYVVDTPGFSTIDLDFMTPGELQYAFREFNDFISECRFSSCLHYKEIGCAVKKAVEDKLIPAERYNAYIEILKELQDCRRIKR